MAQAKGKKSSKKRKVIVEAEGLAYIKASFNNIIISITNKSGHVISWASAGKAGFRGSKKNTPYAAQMAAADAAKTAHEAGLRKVKVYVKGPGAGRESAIRSLSNSGIDVTLIKDVTPIPHNGCRPPKKKKSLKKYRKNMARYTGPQTKKARALGEAIYGFDKAYEKRKYGPGQHGNSRRRKVQSEYSIQLKEKQKAKYTYGLLERQFRNLFEKASRKKGITGEILMQLLEARLDNTVFRMGIAPTRRAARQLVGHKHITVNGSVVNIPSFSLKPGDEVGVREKSKSLLAISESLEKHREACNWVEFSGESLKGKFIDFPEREKITENIKEQLIVELYSK